jgi:deazaflavin-dependent oxidoreductase (nitroreductase family)
MISAGIPTGAPNVLLTVRGRRTGKLRTVPVGVMDFEGRRFVQATYSQTGWAANVRATAEATVTEEGRHIPVRVVELAPEEAGSVLRRALQPYRRRRILRALLGPNARPPIGVLWRYRIRIDETPDEYAADARRHPVFELRPL